MEKFEFVSFEPTPSEKHVGILTVRIRGPVVMVVRYKIVQKKDGSGHFPTVASYKMPNRNQTDEYDECFMLDSRSDHDQMTKFIMHHFSQWQKSQKFPSEASNWDAKQQEQPNPNYLLNRQPQSLPFIQRPEFQPELPFANGVPQNAPEEPLPF